MKKKVIFIINSLKNGGPVNMLYTLVKYIDKERFEAMVVALKQCPKDSEINFAGIGCSTITLDSQKFLNTIVEVRKIVDAWKPDIVHSHGGVADIVNTKLKGSHKSFSTVHCDPYEDFIFKKGKVWGWVRATVFLHTLKKIDYPIACSETVSQKIDSKRNVKFDYIRNGIDLDRLKIDKIITRKEFGIGQDEIVLTFCGYLSKRKNVSFLINAMKLVDRSDIRLLVIGDGTEFEMLKQLAANDNRVIMVGHSTCPAKYLKISDYYITSSLSEGLPLAVMEGMGCGLPAIISDIDSHQEMKRCCGEAVMIFSLRNNQELEDIIKSIRRNNNEKERARKIVYSYLNASRMAADYEQRYLMK